MGDLGELVSELLGERFNYCVYVVLLLVGLHAMVAKNNLIKKLIGMSVFQTAIILFYVSVGVKEGASIPIYKPEHDPHGHHAEGGDHDDGAGGDHEGHGHDGDDGHHHGPQALKAGEVAQYANPLPHVLMLTAIVVGVATLGVALAVTQRIYGAYGSIEEDEVGAAIRKEAAAEEKALAGRDLSADPPKSEPEPAAQAKAGPKAKRKTAARKTPSAKKKTTGAKKSPAAKKPAAKKAAPAKKKPAAKKRKKEDEA